MNGLMADPFSLGGTYAHVSMFRFCAIARVAFHLLVNSVEKSVLLIRLIKVKALALNLNYDSK